MNPQNRYLLKNALILIFSCFHFLQLNAQQNNAGKKYRLLVKPVYKDSLFLIQDLKLTHVFNTKTEALNYVSGMPSLLLQKGYPAASIDSLITSDTAVIAWLYTGPKVNHIELSFHQTAEGLSDPDLNSKIKRMNQVGNFNQLEQLQQRIVSYYEERGYPFASVVLDSIRIHDNRMIADLKIDRGNIYHIDSIRVFGNVNISKSFLHQYLNIPPNSLYNRRRLTDVDKRIIELPFLSIKQPSDVTMLGTGGILNLYVQPKKNSQFNFLVGFLPASSGTGKLQITGDVNLDLKNLLGGGERLFFKWQQLQPQSPRLNIGFNKPYIFNSPIGVDGLFDLFKKDSNFLQINARLGLQYLGTGTQSGKVFIQWQNTSLLEGAIDTNQVKLTRSLPLNIDVSAVNMGIDYAFNNTNYRFNPSRGSDITLNVSVGIKNVKRNNDIISIKDPAFNFSKLYDSINSKNYQIRLRLNAAHYFPLGKASAIKASFNGGFYGSPVIFRNELFQIGGYSLLRGFDEEGIYATNFGVLSAEYRILLGMNAYLGFFVDAGMVNKRYQRVNLNNTFAGLGTALLYETKSGMLNVSFAIGRQDNSKFDLRQATKLHFGYINYF